MTPADPHANKYCSSTDLGNEASVESFFVLPLLRDLGYENDEIKPKESIETLNVPKGRKKEKYKPDYMIVCRNKPRWLIDAKSTEERPDDWTHQCAGYSLLVNRKRKDKPLRFYMLTNGLLTRVYEWTEEDPVLRANASQFLTIT